MTEHQTLSDLLAALFTAQELMDWIRRLPGGEVLQRSLGERAPGMLAFEAEGVLRRHGYVNTALFDGLVEVRPMREKEIRALQARLEAEALRGAGPQHENPPPPFGHLPPAKQGGGDATVGGGSRFGSVTNFGPSQQGDGSTMTVQSAPGGMIFNAPVTVSGGHLGPVNHVSVGAVPVAAAPPKAPAPAPVSPVLSTDPKLHDLRALLAKRQVVVIAGAGVSLSATGGAAVAGWKGLLSSGITRCRDLGLTDEKWARLRQQLLDDGDTADWIHVAEQITTKLGGPAGGEFKRWLRETVGSLKAVDTSLLQAVKSLDCPIATTNYDHLLEQATDLRAVSWDEDSEVERALRGDDPGILHLHGHWRRPESVVFGTASYLHVQDDPHADAVRKALRTTSSLLYIGCGDTTQDPNLGAFLAWSGRTFAGSEYRSYRLEKDADVARIQAQHPPEQRISVLGYGPDHLDLPGFLRGLVG